MSETTTPLARDPAEQILMFFAARPGAHGSEVQAIEQLLEQVRSEAVDATWARASEWLPGALSDTVPEILARFDTTEEAAAAVLAALRALETRWEQKR